MLLAFDSRLPRGRTRLPDVFSPDSLPPRMRPCCGLNPNRSSHARGAAAAATEESSCTEDSGEEEVLPGTAMVGAPDMIPNDARRTTFGFLVVGPPSKVHSFLGDGLTGYTKWDDSPWM
jgi:hypothetical protein